MRLRSCSGWVKTVHTDWPFPAPVDDRGADHLRAGLAMPHIALPATCGEPVELSALNGRTVIFVYPWTGTPGLPDPPNWDHIPGAHGSTPEALQFAKLKPGFDSLGVRIFGLSAQHQAEQQGFAERNTLPFTLLSDAEYELQTALKLPTFATGGVTYLKRLTLILDADRIDRVFYPVHPPDTHADEVLASLQAGVK